jgi:hypothetical protein
VENYGGSVVKPLFDASVDCAQPPDCVTCRAGGVSVDRSGELEISFGPERTSKIPDPLDAVPGRGDLRSKISKVLVLPASGVGSFGELFLDGVEACLT